MTLAIIGEYTALSALKESMRFIAFAGVVFLAAFSARASSIELPPPPVGAVPGSLLSPLFYTVYYEDFMAQGMQIFRQYAQKKDSFTKEDLENTNTLRLAAWRADQVRDLLRLDLDGDGKVSRKEVERYASNLNSGGGDAFIDNTMMADKNDDTAIVYQEMLAYAHDKKDAEAPQEPPLFNELFALDTNKDGTLTAQEFRISLQQLFQQYDTDKNHVLSTEEKARAAQAAYSPPPIISPQKLPLDKDEELHVVGLSEGNIKTGNTVHGPTASILVNRPGKKVALLLTSCEALKWKIRLSDKTRLGHVYFSSNAVSPLPEVWLNDKSYAAAKMVPVTLCAYDSQGKDFNDLLAYIHTAMGRDKIESFHGYVVPETVIEITHIDHSPEPKHDRQAGAQEDTIKKLIPASPDKVVNLTFHASINHQYGNYLPTGKLVDKLPEALKGAVFAGAGQYYALADNGIKRLDMKGTLLEEIPVTLDVPLFSWAEGIAFNEKTKQVAVTSLGGEGFLYHYDIKTKKWSATSQNDYDYYNLAYDPMSKNYISSTFSQAPIINYIDTKGKLVKTETLDIKKFPGMLDFTDTHNIYYYAPIFEVIPNGQYLVIIVGSEYMPGSEQINAKRIYLYNRKTEAVVLTYVAS